MSKLGKIASNIGGLVGGPILRSIFKKKKTVEPVSTRPIIRDDVASRISQEGILRQRRGSSTDILNGQGGSEAPRQGIASLFGN